MAGHIWTLYTLIYIYIYNGRLNIKLIIFSPSHLEGSSTSVGRPGHCQSPVLAVENVDVRQINYILK